MKTPSKLVYCVIHESDLMDLLRRTHEGEHPDVVFAEWYANSDHEDVQPQSISGKCGVCDKPTDTLPCPHCRPATPDPLDWEPASLLYPCLICKRSDRHDHELPATLDPQGTTP